MKQFNFTVVFLALALFSSRLCFSQDEEMVLNGDTLTLKSGLKFHVGQKLKMGTGSTPDGDFKFVRRSATSMFQYNSTTGHQGLANSANALPRRCSGYEYKIVRIDKRGSKKNGFQHYLVLNTGAIRHEVDILNAIDAGEIVVPEEFRKKNVTSSTTSLADELKKLKDLHDAGALSKEEYEAAKKKLLEQ